MAIVYLQVTPELEFSRPRSVERPEIVRYCRTSELDRIMQQLGNVYKMIKTASLSFSVNVMARFPRLGTMSPTMKAPMEVSVMENPGKDTETNQRSHGRQ
jgi:hypothetical protein